MTSITMVGSHTDIRHFDQYRKRLFDKPLANYGFNRVETLSDSKEFVPRTENEQNRSQAYVKERVGQLDLYITIWVTTYYRSDVDRIEIRLGEGELSGYPEEDFSSIKLSVLVCSKDPSRKTDMSEGYGIYTMSDIQRQLEQVANAAANDLFTFGQDFLNDNLQEFYEIRREGNRNNRYWQSVSESIDTRTDQYAESLRQSLALWKKYTE